MNHLWIVVLLIAWVAITAFLCAAAILNPNLNDAGQFVWSAVAVAGTTWALFYVLGSMDD